MTDALATTNANPLATLQQMLTMPGISPEAIERMSALAERWQDREREREYMESMNACQSELPAVTKDSFNKHTESWYAKLDKIAKTILTTAHKHGFSLSFGTAPTDRGDTWLKFTLDVMHVGGHSRRYEREIPIDNVGKDGKTNKTVAMGTISSETLAKKMLLCGAFNVTLQGMEDAAGTPLPQTPEQAEEERKGFATIVELLETREVDMARFWQAMGCERVEDIDPKRYKAIIKQLAAKPVKR